MMQKMAFVFPGQGSQSVGMLADIAERSAVMRETIQEASEVLGYDVWALMSVGPVEQLNQTEFTQPVLLAASVALWRNWSLNHETRPILLAGHSLGEYSALVCAEFMSFAEALKLVALRGRLMQAAVPMGQGAMAAILGLADEAVIALCHHVSTTDDYVYPANYNSVGQIVIAGHQTAVLRALEQAKSFGAKRAMLLPVSVPSHCPLMRSAAETLQTALVNIKCEMPKIPVVQNVDATVHKTIVDIQAALVSQLYQPVRWVESIRYIMSQGISTLFECGPGAVLSGLQKRIDASLVCHSLSQGALT